MGNAQSSPGLAQAWDFYMRVSPITRNLLSGSLLTLALVQGGVVSPQALFFERSLVFQKLQVWRLATNFLYFGPASVPLAFNLLMLYNAFSSLETRGASKVLERLGVGCAAMLAVATVSVPWVKFNFLSAALVMLANTLWSIDEPETTVGVWGIPVKNKFLPFALIALNVVTGASIAEDLLGFACAHIAQTIINPLPRMRGDGDSGSSFLYRAPGARTAAARQASTAGRWGTNTPNTAPPTWANSTGYRLGGN